MNIYWESIYMSLFTAPPLQDVHFVQNTKHSPHLAQEANVWCILWFEGLKVYGLECRNDQNDVSIHRQIECLFSRY